MKDYESEARMRTSRVLSPEERKRFAKNAKHFDGGIKGVGVSRINYRHGRHGTFDV